MNKIIKSNKGVTLLEIIISLAILGIIITALVNAFSFGAINIFYSGQKSEELMNLQSIISQINSEDFSNKGDIESFLTAKGYKQTSSESDLKNKTNDKMINFYVSNEETKNNVKGHTVSLLAFINEDGSRYSRLSTFVITGGS